MKALHQRMEELLEDYSARYGANQVSRDYDPVSFLPVDPGAIPKTRRLSSSRRRVHGPTSECLCHECLLWAHLQASQAV